MCVNINDAIRPDLWMLGKSSSGAWKAIGSQERAIDRFDTRTTEVEEATNWKRLESKQGGSNKFDTRKTEGEEAAGWKLVEHSQEQMDKYDWGN
jgi:hypothetical protein